MIRKLIFLFIFFTHFQICFSQVIQDSTFQQEDSISKIILTQSSRSFFEDSFKIYIPHHDYVLLSDPNPFHISLNNYKSLVLDKNKFEDKISNFQNGFSGFDHFILQKKNSSLLIQINPIQRLKLLKQSLILIRNLNYKISLTSKHSSHKPIHIILFGILDMTRLIKKECTITIKTVIMPFPLDYKSHRQNQNYPLILY